MEYFCNTLFLVNYEESCCLKHFFILSDFANLNQTNLQFGKLLLRILSKIYESLRFLNKEETNKKGYFESLVNCLTICNEYIVFYYNQNKIDNAKYISFYAIKIYSINKFYELNNIVASIYTNTASLYFGLKIEKAKEMLENALNLSDNGIDSIIIQNNLIKVYAYSKSEKLMDANVKMYSDCVKVILNNDIKDYDINQKETLIFILFNSCLYINSDISYNAIFEIAKVFIGIDHFLTQKFLFKLYEKYYYPKNIALNTTMKKESSNKELASDSKNLNKNAESYFHTSTNEFNVKNNNLYKQNTNIDKKATSSKLDSNTELNIANNYSTQNINNQSKYNFIKVFKNPKNMNSNFVNKIININATTDNEQSNHQNKSIYNFDNNTKLRINEEMLGDLTREFDKELEKSKRDEDKIKNNTYANKQSKSSDVKYKKINNATYANRRNSKIKDMFMKVVNEKTVEKLNDRSQRQTKLENIFFEAADIMNKVSAQHSKDSKEIKEVEPKQIISNSMANSSKSNNKEEIKKMNILPNLDPNIENNIAQYSQGFAFNIQQCEDIDLLEAKTYYSKNSKKNAKKLYITSFKFYLKKFLGLEPITTKDIQNQKIVIDCNKCINNDSLPKDKLTANPGTLNQEECFISYFHALFKKRDINYLAIHKITRRFNNKIYDIELSIDSNNKIIMKAIFIEDVNVSVDKIITLSKLESVFLSKTIFIQTLPNYLNSNFFRNINEIIAFFIIYNVFISKKEGVFQLAISSNFVGNYLHPIKVPILEGRNLYYDLLIYSKMKGRFVIFESEDM